MDGVMVGAAENSKVVVKTELRVSEQNRLIDKKYPLSMARSQSTVFIA